MSVVTIIGGVFCHTEKVADSLSKTTGWRVVGNDLLDLVSDRSGFSRKKLEKALYSPPGVLDSLTHEQERCLAATREILAGLIAGDNVIISHPAAFLLPRYLTQILRVCCIGNFEWRLKQAVSSGNLSSRSAANTIHRLDGEMGFLAGMTTGEGPWEERNFDAILPMHRLSVDEAVGIIMQNLANEAIRSSETTRKTAKDYLLATKIGMEIAHKGYDAEVVANEGKIEILINKFIMNLKPVEKELSELSQSIPGISQIVVRPGSRYNPPPLIRTPELSLPSKVLLVDDEKDFVQTLSERLKNRKYESSIAYGGEEAIAMIETEEPDVMVLDLKMPGIDGIEVLRRTRRDHPNVEVIILTGHGSEQEETLAMELGAFAYLKKPVNIDVLSRTMQAAYQKIRQNRALMSSDDL